MQVASWYFEVWNEPNCDFYTGTKAEFYALAATVADAVHAVHPSLRVGGPVTCQNGWIQDTLDFINNGTVTVLSLRRPLLLTIVVRYAEAGLYFLTHVPNGLWRGDR